MNDGTIKTIKRRCFKQSTNLSNEKRIFMKKIAKLFVVIFSLALLTGCGGGGGGDSDKNKPSIATPTIAESFPSISDVGLTPNKTTAWTEYQNVPATDVTTLASSLQEQGFQNTTSSTAAGFTIIYKKIIERLGIPYLISINIFYISNIYSITIAVESTEGDVTEETIEDITDTVDDGNNLPDKHGPIHVSKVYQRGNTVIINRYVPMLKDRGFNPYGDDNCWRRVDDRNIFYDFCWNSYASTAEWSIDDSERNDINNGGNNGVPTIENAFPALSGLTVNSAHRRITYVGVSKADADALKQSLTKQGFKINSIIYSKDILYSSVLYDTSAGVQDLYGGEYMVSLAIRNADGDVAAGMFNTIFGSVNGELFSTSIIRIYDGDHTAVLKLYETKLQSAGFNKDNSTGYWQKEKGGFTYDLHWEVVYSGTSYAYTMASWFIN
jgi:hypothetical protein